MLELNGKLASGLRRGQAGFNTFDVYVQNEQGTPVTDAEKVSLIVTMLGMNMGEQEAVASNAGERHYLAHGDYVPMVGTWQIEVLVRRHGQDDVRVKLILNVSR